MNSQTTIVEQADQPSEAPHPHRLLSASYVRELCGGISDMTMWRWLNDENLNFPRPVMIQRRRFWREAELIEWIEGRSSK